MTESTIQNIEQTGFARCLSVENEAILQNNSRRYTNEQFEEWLAPRIAKIKADRAAGKAPQAIYNIPVVIHIVHNGDAVNTPGNATSENISDAQAISQIDVMNEDYRRLVGTPGGANSTGVAVDVEINFCLAQQDASGNATTGIIRHNITPYSNAVTAGVVDDWEIRSDVETMKTVTQWDPTKYINFWSIKPGGAALNAGGLTGLLGYAQFPDPAATGVTGLGAAVGGVGAANTDGVVAGYDAFGTIAADDGSFLMNPTYNLGRTMTHEVGHWLGLRHIWGDGPQAGSCGVDDYCADTPNAAQPNYNCVANNSCGGSPTDQIQNYMDYTNDACMDTFTQDQKDRMQAIMGGSPRRMELNSSIGCQAPAPYIGYSTATQSVTEGTTCGYTDVVVTAQIAKAPSANADVTITTSGSATGTDFMIIGGNLTFPIGSAADQTFTVRVYNDSFVEGDDTITLGMTLNANGGDALITTVANQQQVITITNDDTVPSASTAIDVYDEDFEDAADWAIYDRDGDGRFWGTVTGLDGYGDILGAAAYSETDGTILSAPANSYNPDQYFVSAAFTIPAGASSATVSYAVGSYHPNGAFTEHYSVYFTTVDPFGAYADIEEFVLENDRELPATGTEVRNHDLSAYAGMTGKLAFRHHNSTGNGLLLVDTINVDAVTGTSVQTALNSGTPDQDALSNAGTVYSANAADGFVMADITNTNGVDYGCVNTSVSRATGASVMYQVAGTANYVTGKTFTITPASVQAGGNATLKFYFTEAEIVEWETTTGNSRATLAIIKDNGASESVAATIGAFGTNVTLEGTFTSGINGTYYFGKIEAVLGVAENQLNIMGLYPNPSNGIFNLSVDTSDDATITLHDIRGRRVHSHVYSNNSDVFTTKLDFSTMASGVYMLHVKSGTKQAVKKVVIQ